MSRVALYGKNLLIGLDQFVNVILAGAPDETISSRMWRNREHRAAGLAVKMIDWLFSWKEDNHCQKSHENGDRQMTEAWR